MKDYAHWQQEVLRHVRYRPDRAKIAQELTAHYIDHMMDLERIGFDAETARQKALEAMGSAEDVGRGLDRAHSPVLGWLWQISRVLAVVLVVLALWFGVVEYGWTDIQTDIRFAEHEKYREYGYIGSSEENRHLYTMVDEVFMHQTWERCGYEMAVPYAALWVRPMHDGTPIYYLTAVLTCDDYRFWDDAAALAPMTITTDWGMTWYASGMGEHLEDIPPHFNAYTVERAPFHSTRIITTCISSPQTKWVELNYDGSDPWSVRIEWEEGIYS